MSMALTKSKRGHCKMLIKKEKYQKETSFFLFNYHLVVSYLVVKLHFTTQVSL